MTMHIGIYGGAFDPPHLAHVALAEAAVQQFQFDQLLVTPTGDAVHKRRHLTAGYHRVAMARLAFAGLDQALVDTREIDRGGASYTIDTIMELRRLQPGARLTLIIGQDQLLAFHTWRAYETILAQASLAVAVRGGEVRALAESSIRIPYTPIQFAPHAVSSSDLRQMIRTGDSSFAAKMNPSVAAYIQEHALYQHN